VVVGAYLQSLSAQLLRSYSVDPQRVTLRSHMDRVLLDLNQAIPCGLILNELLTNAFKHAFPDERVGEVHVALHTNSNRQVTLTVQDTGIGLPEGIDFRHTDSLGLQLVFAHRATRGNDHFGVPGGHHLHPHLSPQAALSNGASIPAGCRC
jgi:two-component sensor histidine kinase